MLGYWSFQSSGMLYLALIVVFAERFIRWLIEVRKDKEPD